MAAQAAVSGPARPPRPLGATTRVWTLHPGDVVCAERGDRLETLLGSCVAIVLMDPKRTVGAMCHVVHGGEIPAGRPMSDCAPESTWGEPALRRMFASLRAIGITPGLCQAYVCGGGNMFPTLSSPGHVGDQNVRWAVAALAREGVQVLDHDLGGSCYRQLAWTVGPGRPEVRSVEV